MKGVSYASAIIQCEYKLKNSQINNNLYESLKGFEPTGLGNPGPTFISKKVEVVAIKTVGKDAKHLKLKLKQDEHTLDSIFFGGGEIYSKMIPGSKIDITYQVEENIWNGYKSIQLKIKDISHIVNGELPEKGAS